MMKLRFQAIRFAAAGWLCASTISPLGYSQQPAKPQSGQAPASAGTESGVAVFQQRCMSCHGNPNDERAPAPAAIRELPPEKIYESLTTGSMKGQGDALSEDQRRMVSAFMSGRPLGTLQQGDAKSMPNQCPSNPPLTDPAAAPGWNGWGADVSNTRFQPAQGAGLTADQVPRLKLKWAFGFPGGLSAYGQPTIVSGRVFVGSDTGYVYSLDAKTGCVYWSYQTKGAVRSAVSLGPVKGRGATKYAIYFGDAHANVYALDAQNGQQLWITKVDEEFLSRITGAPTLYAGRLYVPVSSSEEYTASTLDYPCCTFRGSVSALNANTGARIWRTFVMDAPKPTKKNSKGVQLYAPAGAAVWSAPTVDARRKRIYFSTGDSYTEPAAKTSDAVLAVDMKTGKMLWVYQAEENDAFLGGCNGPSKTENCPALVGPDQDLGNSPLLKALPDGKRVLLVGKKDATVIALDPDRNGALLWKVNVAPPDASKGMNPFMARLGGIVWGGSADDDAVYYGLNFGGIAAVQLSNGARKWFAPTTGEGRRVSNTAATSLIPGVVFAGGSDGKLRALATADGRVLWEVATARDFETGNKVPAKGGAMSMHGPTIVGGMLFVGSGYGVSGGNGMGNVLLAFAAE
jgi:polyvinyl alcohol dehydrogenase (cytochrome)